MKKNIRIQDVRTQEIKVRAGQVEKLRKDLSKLRAIRTSAGIVSLSGSVYAIVIACSSNKELVSPGHIIGQAFIGLLIFAAGGLLAVLAEKHRRETLKKFNLSKKILKGMRSREASRKNIDKYMRITEDERRKDDIMKGTKVYE